MSARTTHPRPVALWRLVTVFLVGLGAGVATSYLQGVLPTSANFLANSGAVWTIIAFLLALWVAVRPGTGVAAGLLALLGEVLGYYAIASPLRDIATSSAERALWIVAALIVGPCAGWAAHLARHGRPAKRVAAAAAACGVVAGEGVYALIRLSHAIQGWTEVVIAAAAVIATAAWLGRSWASRAVALPTVLIIGALAYSAYAYASA